MRWVPRRADLRRRLTKAARAIRGGAVRVSKAGRHPSRRLITFVVLAAGGVAAVLGRVPVTAWIVGHPYFAVTEIVVTPTARVRADAVLRWIGVKPGVSIWSLDPEALATRLERQPWIRTASVRREFPSRLVVQVAEREPAAMLLIDQLYYVDRNGVVFARAGGADAIALPFLTGIEAALLDGERPFPRHAIRQALKLLQLIRGAGLPFRVSEVHIEREQGITVFLVEPRAALVFGWNRLPLKVGRLRDVLSGFAGRESEILEIDLTYSAQAVVRLRQGGGGGRRTRA